MGTTKRAPRMSRSQCAALYQKAAEAGEAAAAACTPTPMVVGTPKDPVASLTGASLEESGGFSETEPVYVVPSGICGTAYVTVRPATCSFARYLRATQGSFKAYYGGEQLPIRGYGQSFEKSKAYAGAFARVVEEAGLSAYVEEWIT